MSHTDPNEQHTDDDTQPTHQPVEAEPEFPAPQFIKEASEYKDEPQENHGDE